MAVQSVTLEESAQISSGMSLLCDVIYLEPGDSVSIYRWTVNIDAKKRKGVMVKVVNSDYETVASQRSVGLNGRGEPLSVIENPVNADQPEIYRILCTNESNDDKSFSYTIEYSIDRSESDDCDLHTGHGEEVDLLIEATRQYFEDDRWTINQKLWSDGDTDAYAYKRNGQTDEGHIIEERLSVVDGEVHAAEVIFSDEIVEERDLGVVE